MYSFLQRSRWPRSCCPSGAPQGYGHCLGNFGTLLSGDPVSHRSWSRGFLTAARSAAVVWGA
eukprot:7481318-Lingulodinium_polyedra.AAC.1